MPAFWLTSILVSAMALPLAAVEPAPGTLRTINDYLTGQPLTAAIADGTVYEFRATVPKVNFWKTPAPLDGLWLESTNKKTLIWMSSTSGTMATDTVPCPPAAGSNGGVGNNADCQNNSPSQTNGCVCPPGQACCPGTANCYDPATQECCGGTPHDNGTGCCVENMWYANGSTAGTCQVCSNGTVVATPCATGCGDTLTTNCIPGAITNVRLTGVSTNCAGIPMTATVSYGTTNGSKIITSAHHCGDTTNALPVTWVSNSWSVTGAKITSGGSSTDSSVTFTSACGNGRVNCTVYGTNADSACGFSASASTSTNFTFHQTKITFDDQPARPSTMWPWTWEATLQAVCVSGANNTSTGYSTTYTSLASITYGFTVDSSGIVTNMHKSGDGHIGDINKIVVTTFAANSGDAGITIEANFIGCCDNGQMNWVQTLTLDTQPVTGETIPFTDALVKPPTQTPYYYGWPPGGPTWLPQDFMFNQTTCP